MIPVDQYKQIVEVLPILCVDIIVTNTCGEYLLVKRANEPLKGQWWVIGGRVYKGETLEQAAIRKVKEEVSLDLDRVNAIGYYEDVFFKNSLGVADGLQTVSIVFRGIVDGRQAVKLDSQSTDWKYSKALPENFIVISLNGVLNF